MNTVDATCKKCGTPISWEGLTPQFCSRCRPIDIAGAVIAYEEGELSEDQKNDLFQHLVDSGLAWKLQGSYGRTAEVLIREGAILPPRGKTREQFWP